MPPLRRLGEQAEQAYAFFNNNNQTDGAAQAPSGAFLLRKLLDRGERSDRLMRVLAVTHGPAVQPELFGDVVVAEGHALTGWDIRLQGAPPGGFDAVLVFGGDQNVGEELEHPWLHEEYDALRGWVAERVPLFARVPRRADARACARRARCIPARSRSPASTRPR